MQRGWFLGLIILLAVVIPVLGLGAALLGQGLPGDIVGPSPFTLRRGGQDASRPRFSGQATFTPDASTQEISGQGASFEIAQQRGRLDSTLADPFPGRPSPSFPSPIPPTPDGGQLDPSQERLLVKTGSLNLIAADTLSAVDQVKSAVEQLDGLVTGTEIVETGRQGDSPRATLTIRVPSDSFEQALSDIKAVASRVASERTNTLDQTEQKADLDAQLNNLRATESQLQQILSRAQTVEEILQVQRELTSTRTRIERLEAQLDNLQGAAAFSTIRVQISTEKSAQPIVNPDQPSLDQELKVAIQDAVKLYRFLFLQGLRWAVVLLPVLVLGWLVKKFWSKTRRPDSSPSSSSTSASSANTGSTNNSSSHTAGSRSRKQKSSR